MSSTRATISASSSSSPRRGLAPSAWPVVAMLACGAWLVGGSQLRAFDLDAIQRIEQREQASRDLKRASENVEKARAVAAAARERLDAFMAEHFERHDQSAVPPAVPETNREASSAFKAEHERLQTRLLELREHREDLLSYLTDEHPQVVHVQGRIAVLEARMAELGRAGFASDGPVDPQTGELRQRWTEYTQRLARQVEQDAAAYQRLWEQWRAAKLNLDQALAAERAAAQRLAARTPPRQQLTAATGETRPTNPLRDFSPRKSGQQEADGHADSAPAAAPGSSQPLALAAILIALAVAALAAVRLARATADPIFASVDEVAAALAIPVVGIIPATAARVQRTTAIGLPWRRASIVAGQLLLATLIFMAVALAVQNPGAFWKSCTHPMETAGSLLRAISGG